MRTKKTVVSIVLLAVLLSLLLVSPVAGIEEPGSRTIKVTKYYVLDSGVIGPKEGWKIRVYYHNGTEWVQFGQDGSERR